MVDLLLRLWYDAGGSNLYIAEGVHLGGKMASRFDDDDEVTDFRFKLNNNSLLLLSTIR